MFSSYVDIVLMWEVIYSGISCEDEMSHLLYKVPLCKNKVIEIRF